MERFHFNVHAHLPCALYQCAIGTETDSLDAVFWKNYFFHCEATRIDELSRREECGSEIKLTRKSSSSEKGVNEVSNSPLAEENDAIRSSLDEVERFISGGNNDDESLVPVTSDTEEKWEDDKG